MPGSCSCRIGQQAYIKRGKSSVERIHKYRNSFKIFCGHSFEMWSVVKKYFKILFCVLSVEEFPLFEDSLLTYLQLHKD